MSLGLDAGGLPRRGFRISVRVMMGLVVLCAAGAWGLRSLLTARDDARCTQCVNNLRQIGLALQSYHHVQGCFPPAFLPDAAGKPLVSWRLLIMAYMDQWPMPEDEAGKPRPRGVWDYRRDEPWDSPNNRTLAAPAPSIFVCPNHRGAGSLGLTNYVAVVGSPTAFPGSRPTAVAEFRDGTGATFLIIEAHNVAIGWSEPRDLDWNQMSFRLDDPSRPGISSPHPRGSNVLMGDGSVRTLDRSTPEPTVRARLTIGGGEVITHR